MLVVEELKPTACGILNCVVTSGNFYTSHQPLCTRSLHIMASFRNRKTFVYLVEYFSSEKFSDGKKLCWQSQLTSILDLSPGSTSNSVISSKWQVLEVFTHAGVSGWNFSEF